MHEMLSDIGIAIVAATGAALVARLLRQPLILGYLVAGVLVGPEMGFGLVKNRESIHLTSELGLILLLFIIGLEMDLQKLINAGRALVLAGSLQFLLCAALGGALAAAIGFGGGGRFDGAYLAVCLALSSTMIVIKLLYDKHELMTLPGRLTLGVLVFQDVWAILALAVQPTLLNPSLGALAGALLKGALLVAASMGASRFVLPRLFAFVAKVPELLLVTALAWCFLVSGAASQLGLSREMGALMAGVGMSTFPYNLDVIAKVVNIRDFFVTLFFVALGMQIPQPTAPLLGMALLASLFLIASRFLTLFPILRAAGCGLRTSLLPAINLAQLSEFSLVIATLGLGFGHVSAATVALLTFVFAITSVSSTYMIAYNHQLQAALGRVLERFGVRDRDEEPRGPEAKGGAPLVLLGFYRDASSIVHEIESASESGEGDPTLAQLMVIDFNPEVLQELKRRGIRCLYGDVASADTLQHASIHEARVVFCSLTDSILKGTTNLRLLQQLRRLCPQAMLVLSAETLDGALSLYDAGADFVFVPRLHSAHFMADVLRTALDDGLVLLRREEVAALRRRDEVLA